MAVYHKMAMGNFHTINQYGQAMAIATAMATAMAVIRPEHACRGRTKWFFLFPEKRVFIPISVISGTSNPYSE